jgi:outer membrane lipoprotein-sorting protein
MCDGQPAAHPGSDDGRASAGPGLTFFAEPPADLKVGLSRVSRSKSASSVHYDPRGLRGDDASMSELGDLLVLMHEARDRFRTVRATIREWGHVERSERALKRQIEKSRAAAHQVAVATATARGAAEPAPDAWEALIRLWLEKPAQLREEREDAVTGRSFGIRDGDRWWSYSPALGALSNEADPHVRSGLGQTTEHMLDPAPLIGELRLEPLTWTRFAGRPALRARATPRLGEDTWSSHTLFLLGPGADELELMIDGDRGILLRTEARIDGEPFQVRETLEVAFDEAFPPETFVFVPPAGEDIRSAASMRPSREVRIEEAVALAPFRVFIPTRLPRGWALSVVRYKPPTERPRVPASLGIWYHPPEATHVLTIGETAADEPRPYEHVPTRPIERSRRTIYVWEHAEQVGQRQSRVWVELEGTGIELSSDLELETLLAITDSLAPASGEPPRLAE